MEGTKVDLTTRLAVVDEEKWRRLPSDKKEKLIKRIRSAAVVAALDVGIELDDNYCDQGADITCVHEHNRRPDGKKKSQEEAEQYACDGCMVDIAQDGEV